MSGNACCSFHNRSCAMEAGATPFSRGTRTMAESCDALAGLDQGLEMCATSATVGASKNRETSTSTCVMSYTWLRTSVARRISAQCEEIIVNTDLLDLQDLCPVLGQRLLERRPWRDGGPRQAGAGRETQFSRQADTLHFAGRAFWDFPDDEHLARDLEVGDAPDGELANVFRRRRSVRPQHDSRRDGKGYGLCHCRMFQSTSSTSRGAFFPPRLIISRMRPARNRYPSSSK